ncbi:tRNA (adenosine(37)-N6)-dimethylallyltransferase MiaA [Columbia Basin potato purple top phytoplasma]|uniref:tRNA dimethylallyltransferase n=1 Tax=Columbia Basin potato purple top phytoplasma TaxID=307134 RepID=A0ABT5LB48_9MOLU|nr:tRNA (adenosine(37)-N6)-dimethylallyltransferase MiaA [Columbia Basin potato purple top phytoplasma]MDC9031923.1 tRNA (adenosine(37)-N6)-dimethylallyltransferase MiaA [Columbia Basin potato purple top phytoplasma]
MKKIIVISGPTASGKTDLSIELAIFFQGEIINADSVQIYKKFDIGSAKATAEELEKVKHHLLNKIEPEDSYNIYNFQKDVRSLITQIKTPFLVGGSGLYIKAALFDYELIPENKSLHHIIQTNNLSIKQILQTIKQKDPDLIIDTKNHRRIISAYKQIIQNNLRSQKTGKNIPLFDILFFYLDTPKNILKERLVLRLEQMLKKGFIEEVEYLMQYYPKASLNIIGYREIKDFLEKKINLKDAKNLIIRNSLKYAKRQKTWFKNQIPSLQIINTLNENWKEQIFQKTQKFLKKE